jgi:hypothetical protein
MFFIIFPDDSCENVIFRAFKTSREEKYQRYLRHVLYSISRSGIFRPQRHSVKVIWVANEKSGVDCVRNL